MKAPIRKGPSKKPIKHEAFGGIKNQGTGSIKPTAIRLSIFGRMHRKFVKRQARQIKAVNAKFIQMHVPAIGEVDFVTMNGSFEFVDFLLYFLQMMPPVEEAIFSTLALNEHTLKILDLLPCKKTIWISSYFIDSDKAQTLQKAYSQGRLADYDIGFYRTHAKMILLKAGANYFYFSGSMNLRASGTVEDMVIANIQQVYEAKRAIILPMVAKYNFIRLMEQGIFDCKGIEVPDDLDHVDENWEE